MCCASVGKRLCSDLKLEPDSVEVSWVVLLGTGAAKGVDECRDRKWTMVLTVSFEYTCYKSGF